MLIDSLNQKIVAALKAHETVRLDTLRMLSSALKYAQIDKMRPLTEDEELDVIKKEAKKRSDAIEAYKNAGAPDRAEKEAQELVILKEFLPAELSRQTLEQFVDEAIAENGDDFGKVMRAVIQKAAGNADGKVVSELVRAKLQK
jgi:uncharacterized protein YqeY